MNERDQDGGLSRRGLLQAAAVGAAASTLGLGCGDDGTGTSGTSGAGGSSTSGTSGTPGTTSGSTSGATSGGEGGGGGGPGPGPGPGGTGGAPGVGGSGQGGEGGGTPSCEETESDIEGPFYSEDAPVVEGELPGASDLPGVQLLLAGRVTSVGSCAPLAGAILDIWQADDDGAYDNQGFILRGKVETDADGYYVIGTIIPGNYLNGDQFRPAHIHVKVTAPGHAELTTQLYFPDDPYNDIDPWFDPRLLIDISNVKGALNGRFDFAIVET